MNQKEVCMNWDKYENFEEDEFKCPCCGIVNVSAHFLSKLQLGRDYSRIAYDISSGCRCKKHNEEVGGKLDSAHITSKFRKCMGADIKTRNNHERFLVLKGLILAGFTRIGIYDKHIHADAKHNAVQKITWNT